MKNRNDVEDIFKQIHKVKKDFKIIIPPTRPQRYYAPRTAHFIAT